MRLVGLLSVDALFGALTTPSGLRGHPSRKCDDDVGERKYVGNRLNDLVVLRLRGRTTEKTTVVTSSSR